MYGYVVYAEVAYGDIMNTSIGGVKRYHDLNGIGGQADLTWNPLG